MHTIDSLGLAPRKGIRMPIYPLESQAFIACRTLHVLTSCGKCTALRNLHLAVAAGFPV